MHVELWSQEQFVLLQGSPWRRLRDLRGHRTRCQENARRRPADRENPGQHQSKVRSISTVKLELGSGTLSYIDQGNGPAVLLIHAFPLNKTMWAPQIDALSSRYRVIAPDIRGFGESQPPSAWTMHEMADDLHQLLDALGVSDVSVVGVSMGGYIGLTFWWKYPDQVRKIVHANSRARADNEAEKAARNDMI